LSAKTRSVSSAEALPGRAQPIATARDHFVNGRKLAPPYPAGIETAVFGMGCFWGAERKFWQAGEGVWVTAVGYAGGFTPNPTYEETCSGRTGHAEVVLVAYDPAKIAYEALLKLFWENHDPTQGMRQGADVGTQYRSAMFYTSPAQQELFAAAIERASEVWDGGVVTTLEPLGEFFEAEGYHQDFFAKNPGQGYCMAVALPKVAKVRKAYAPYILSA
jgi:peptide-methionine (S)-S-oxide reductase